MIRSTIQHAPRHASCAAKTSAKRMATFAGTRLNHWLGSIDPRPVGILIYHRVADPIPGVPAPTWNVAPAVLREQLAGLVARGFRPMSLQRVIEAGRQGAGLPEKSFVVTFDDGHRSVFLKAWPVLRELQIPATLFLPTAYIDSDGPFPFDDWSAAGSSQVPRDSWRPMTSDECQAITKGGLVELGAHTHTHQDFTDRPEAFERDLARNLEELAARWDVRKAPFAFPFGLVTKPMMDAVRRAGLSCALTTDGALVDNVTSPFGWGRFNVESWDTSATLACKLNGWYSWLPWLRRALTAQRPPAAANWEAVA